MNWQHEASMTHEDGCILSYGAVVYLHEISLSKITTFMHACNLSKVPHYTDEDCDTLYTSIMREAQIAS